MQRPVVVEKRLVAVAYAVALALLNATLCAVLAGCATDDGFVPVGSAGFDVATDTSSVDARVDASSSLCNTADSSQPEAGELTATDAVRRTGDSKAEEGTGTDTATDTATDTGTDTGTEADTETGTDTGTEADTETETDTNTDTQTWDDPKFPHMNAVIDAVRGSVPTWATFIHAISTGDGWKFREVGYKTTAHKVDFWPASVIKIYPAVASLIIIKQLGVTLDAKATFYHRTGKGAWVKDITRSVRQMIYGTFNCSSNSDYTLLLRLAGVDWLNTKLLTAAWGFSETALMVGYVTARPYVYYRTEQQRIVLKEGTKTVERTHSWGGTMWSKKIPCTVVYSKVGAANCSSTHDMAEHVRRIAHHESLPPKDQFAVRKADLDWLRYGGKTLQMSNKACSALWAGVKKVFPNAKYLHKGGKISSYALGVHHVADAASGVEYVLGVATKSTTKTTEIRIAESIARMAQNPHAYVHLNNLKDQVNPVKAKLLVHSAKGGVLDLVTKPSNLSSADPTGWKALKGSEIKVAAGTKWYDIKAACSDKSGKVHIKGRLTVGGGKPVFSDLHFVIIDAKVPCP